MRIAALYDIHANLPALDAVLRDVRQAQVDQIVIGGDLVLGPMPREALDCLQDLEIPVHFIEGNCDREVLAQLAGTVPNTLPEQVRKNIRWVAQQLRLEDQLVLASWPKTLLLEVPEVGKVLFCHATPRTDNEIFTRLTPEVQLRPVFEGVASVVVCGHTHMQFDRTIGSVRVVNAGSVGMPFGKPGADWLLLGPQVELRHTDYDLTKAAERIRLTNYPQAEDFAARNVLAQPSEEAMLAAFTKVELS
jgi:putative phosphoesterase